MIVFCRLKNITEVLICPEKMKQTLILQMTIWGGSFQEGETIQQEQVLIRELLESL